MNKRWTSASGRTLIAGAALVMTAAPTSIASAYCIGGDTCPSADKTGTQNPNPSKSLVGHEGLEPSANGLRIHCSTD